VRVNHQAFFCSLFFARLADQILLFLVPLVVFQTTQKVSWSGIAFFIEALPRYLFFPLFGAFSDRFSPLKLMRISQMYRAVVCIAGVTGYALFGGIGWLIALSAGCGILTSQGFVAREVMLPQIFRAHKFERVLALSQLADQLGVVLGPMAAALLLGWWRWEFVVATSGVLFLLADGAFVLWQRMSGFQAAPPEPPRGHWTQPLRTAVRHVLHLPGLQKVILLAAAENLVIGVTLATSAAMVTGVHHQSGRHYAVLQTVGAIATVLILLTIARVSFSRRTLGLLAFLAICLGGLIAGSSPGAWGYAVGFVLIVGFDKMFNVYIRSARQKIIPPRDYGKTTGVIILLNNLTQPLAGLLVGVFAGRAHTGLLIVLLSLTMAAIGATASIVGPWRQKRRAARIEREPDLSEAGIAERE
jgi:MFS family permease